MIQRNNLYRYDFCISPPIDTGRYVVYDITKDSLLVNCIRNDLNSEYCFVQQGIDWFPPYLVRINKIDYSKFNVPEVKYKYLKDPMHPNSPRYDKK